MNTRVSRLSVFSVTLITAALSAFSLLAGGAPVTIAPHTRPLGYQQLTSLSASTALTIPDPSANYALVSCDANAGINVRFRDDGTAPTASVGTEIVAGATLAYDGDLTAIRFIQVASGAILNVNYYYDASRAAPAR